MFAASHRRGLLAGVAAGAIALGCDSPIPVSPSAMTPSFTRSAILDDGDAALFVGNLVPGAGGNGIFRYRADGAFIDFFVPGGCCMTFGADEHLYVARQNSVQRFHGVTGASLGHFVPPNPASGAIPFIPKLGPDGMMYVSFRGSAQLIRRYDAAGLSDDAFLVDGSALGMTGAQFFDFGPDGNIYFTSGGTSSVLRFSGADGSFIDYFVEPGEGGLAGPSGLTFGPDGTMYVGSPSTDRVLRFDRDGQYIGDFFPAGSGGLDSPVGITFGPDGDFYVASAGAPGTAAVLRYDGATGAFVGAVIGPGDGITTGPRTIEFKSRIAVCHARPGVAGAPFTITIGYLSATEHVAHGDAIGACP